MQIHYGDNGEDFQQVKNHHLIPNHSTYVQNKVTLGPKESTITF